MNAKYKDLYQELVSRDLTSLDEDLFYNEYSTNDEKFGELYSYLDSKGLTTLDKDEFQSEYFGANTVEKKNPDVTELPSEDGLSGRLSPETTKDPVRDSWNRPEGDEWFGFNPDTKKYTEGPNKGLTYSDVYSNSGTYILESNPGVLYKKNGQNWLKQVGGRYVPLTKGDIKAREKILNEQAVKASQFEIDRIKNTPKEVKINYGSVNEPEILTKKRWENVTVSPINQLAPTDQQIKREEEEASDLKMPETKIEPATFEGKLYILEEGKDNENFYNNPVTAETFTYWLDETGKPRQGLDPVKSQQAVDFAKKFIGEPEMVQLSKINKLDKINLNFSSADKFLNKEFYNSNFSFEQDGNQLIINSYLPGAKNNEGDIENTISIDLSSKNSGTTIKQFLRDNLFYKVDVDRFNKAAENKENYIDFILSSSDKLKMTDDRKNMIRDWQQEESAIIEADIQRNDLSNLDKEIKLYESAVLSFNKKVASGKMTQQEFDKENDNISNQYKGILKKQEISSGLLERTKRLEEAQNLLEITYPIEAKGSILGSQLRTFVQSVVATPLKTGLDISLAAGNLMMGDEKFAKFIDGNYDVKKSRGLTNAKIANSAQAKVKELNIGLTDLALTQVTGTNKEYYQDPNNSKIFQALNAVVESVGTAVSGGGSKALTTAAFFALSYNAMEDQMSGPDFDHLTENEKKLISVPYGLVIGQMEKFGFKVAAGAGKNPLFNKFANYIVTKSFKSLPKNAGLVELNSAIQKNIGASIAKGLIKVVGGGVSEGSVEFGQQIFEGVEKFAVNEILKNDNFNQEYFKDGPDLTKAGGISSLIDQGWDAFVLGALAGKMTTSFGMVNNKIVDIRSNNKFDIYKSLVLNKEAREGWIASIKEDQKSGTISFEEMNKKTDEINRSYSTLIKIPASLTTQSQREAFSLLQERENIENEIKDKEPNLVVKETNRIKEINEALKTTSENATKEDNIEQQEGTAEGGISEYQGTSEGQPEVGVSEGGQREATVNEADSSDSTVASKVQQEVASKDDVERRREEDLSAYNEEELNEVYSAGSDQTVGEFINAKYDAELAALGTTQKSDQVATLREQEQAELLKAIPKIESYKVNGEIDKTLMPKTVLAKYNSIYNKYDNLISPLLEPTAEVVIDKPVITTNTTAEVERVKSLTPDSEDGATFNIDGTKYEGVGLVVPVDSMNTTTEELTPEMVADFVAERQEMIGDAGVVKAGIYKFPNSNQVSIDLSVVVPETSREQALEFARLAGQESLFDLATFENIKTGATGENPMSFSPEQHREISKALKEGRMPNVFDTTVEQEVEAIGQLLSGTDAQIDQKVSMIVNKKISKAVSRAAKALSKIIPGTKFIVHDTDESYRAATKEEGLKQSSNGEFNAKTNTIHINGTSANARTVAHEVFHAILINKVKTDANAAAVTKSMVQAIASKINNNPELKKKLENFISNYEENIQNEEKLAELVGMLSENYNSFSTSIKDIIARWIDKLANIFGLDPFNRNETYDMLNTIARKVAKGEVISEADVKTISYKKDVELNAEVRKSLSDQDSIKIAKEVVDKTIKGKSIPTWVQKKTSNKVKFVSFSGEINQKNVKENAPSSYNSIAAKFSNYNTFNINVKQELNNSLVGASKESINKALEYNKKKLLPKINSLLKEIVKIKSNKKLTKEEKLSKISLRNEAIVNIKKIAKMKDLNDQLDAVLNIEHKSTKDSLYNSMFYDLSTNLKRLKGLELANKSEDIYKKAKDIVKSNLLSVYNSVSPRIRQISKLWYDGANLIAQDMANSYQLTNEQAAAIIATQSPQMPWFDNLHLADVIMNLMHSESNNIFTKELFDYYVSKSEGYAEQKKYIPTLSKAIGTPLSKLSDLDAAIFIRAYYDTKLSRKAPIRIPTGTAISEDQKGDSSFSGYSVIAKGISIFRDGSIENISNQLGEANKVRNFYMNIADPSDKRAVTIDTHAMAIALFKPLASNDYEVNFDAATFAFYADAYRELADELGIEARALQSITWEAARAIFPAKEKAKSGYKEKISNIWDELVSGNKSLYKVQEEIFNQAQDPNITEWSEYINILKDEKARTNVSGRIVGLEGARATDNMGAVPGTSIGKSKPSGRTGVSSRGAKVTPRKQLSPKTTQETRMDSEAEAIFKKSLDRGVAWNTAIQNVIDYIQISKWYEDASDIDREQKIRDFRQSKKQKLKKAPSVAKIMGTPKPSTVTVTEKTALKDQIRLEARAAREAKGDLNQKRKILSTAIKGLVKLGKLTAKQAATIINRVSVVNLDNQVMVNRLADYAARVFEKADYQERLSRAFSFRKGIRRLLKGDIQAEVVGMAKKFSKIDPSMVDDIEKYLEMAEIVKNAIKPSRVNRKDLDVNMRESMNIDSVSEFTNDAIENQERILKEELLAVHSELVDAGVIDDKMSLSDIELIINSLKEEADNADYEADILTFLSKRIDTMSAIIKDILTYKINPMTGEEVALTEKNIDIISRILNIDINNVSIKEAIFIAEAMDNFINNNITSSVEAVIEKQEGETELENLIDDKVVASPLRKYFIPKVGQYMSEQIASMPILFEKLFVGAKKGLMVAKKMGWTALINGVNKAEKMFNTTVDVYFKQYSKTKPNGKSFNDAENVYERGMLAFLSRNVSGTATQQAEELKRRVEVLKESVKSLLEGSTKEQKMGEIYQKIYDKLNVESGDIDVIRANVDKINRSAVGWWINQWGTTYNDLSDISLSIYNTMLSSDTSYSTDRYKLLDKANLEEIIEPKNIGAFGRDIEFLDKNKTGVLMESNRPSASKVSKANRYVSLDFDVNNSSAYKAALIDVNTAAAIRRIDGFINSKNFNKLIPIKEDRDIFRKRIAEYIQAAKNKRVGPSDTMHYLDQLTNFLGGIGVGKALGGIDQIVKQTLPIALSTFTNSGRLDILTPASNAWIDSLGMAISNRGQESQSTIESIDRRLDKANSGAKVVSNFIVDAQQIWLKWCLSKPDVFIAKSSFISYYKQYLSNNNQSTDIDWATHNVNQDAADYAMLMVDRQQNVSDAKMAGKIFSSQNSTTKIMRKLFLPFASFSLNQKSRMVSDIKVLGINSGASKQDKIIAARSLLSLPLEMALYQSIGLAIRLGYLAIAKGIIGAVADDDDEEKEKLLGMEMSKEMKNATKYPLRSIVTDFLSPIPIADNTVVGGANLLLSQLSVDQDMIDEAVSKKNLMLKASGKEKMNDEEKQNFIEKYKEDHEYQLFNDEKKSYGTIGIGYDTYNELIDNMNTAYTGQYTDDYMGKKSERFLLPKDQDNIKNAVIFEALFALGIVPRDVNTVTNNIIKLSKNNSLTENQFEKYKAVGKETGGKVTGWKMDLVKSKSKTESTLEELEWIKGYGGLTEKQGQEYIKLSKLVDEVSYMQLMDLQSGMTADKIIKSY
jgi:hypothetical protein